jgi:ATP-dependent DNA helicase RecQ
MSTAADPAAPDLQRTLRERFGLERFRPGQREVIENVLDGRDVLCVMPTGGGKSLCYQLPALLLDGLTLVVSPLIALMKDQVDALTARGIRATFINSTLDLDEQRLRLFAAEGQQYDLVYVAPERFRSGRFVEAMVRARPALLAVDEAHCISEWGHDFRPDYARLGLARKQLGMPPCIALTATATDLVRRDIADQLDLREPAQFVTGFDRPNLSYEVVAARKEQDKFAALARTLGRPGDSAIVYASSRARCEAVAESIRGELRRSAVVYHAGLAREDRTAAQESFMAGDVDVVVATNAFGMGVDKPDIRAVVHYNMPGTLEAYYQEAGRAGRDGAAARCVLLYAPGDRYLQEMFIENEYPPRDVVFRIYDFLRGLDADPIELTHAEIRDAARIEPSESAVGSALKILEGAGALERFRPRENMAIIRIHAEGDQPSFVDRLSPQAHVQRTVLLGLEGLVDRRFGEPIYFHPDDFATALGLDRPALGRAVRALTSELPIDYVPPFRGNALRILDRSRRARDLAVDFTTLDQRKSQEYDKLERMIKYAQTVACRRAYLLGYFGDTPEERCGRCDNCGDSASPPASLGARAIDTDAGREVLLKALSGVARAKGRFGKNVVAQMLAGSNSEKMARWRLTELSTFGILSAFTQAEVVQVLDALSLAGLVEAQEVDRFKPVVTLAEEGWAWLRSQGAEPLDLSLPDDLAAKVRRGGLARARAASPPPSIPIEPSFESEAPTPGADDPLMVRLRALRASWAREANLSPGYVLANETLAAIVRERPSTPHALASIKGIGPSKLERYGSALLEAVRELSPASPALPAGEFRDAGPLPPLPLGEGLLHSINEQETTPAPRPTAPKQALTPTLSQGERGEEVAPSLSEYVPTEEWTWRLIDRGFHLAEIAAIRGLEPAAIVRHATWAAKRGKSVPYSAFLTPEALARWEAWRGEEPPPDAAAMPGLWPLFLACRP